MNLPRIDDLLDKLKDAKIFTALDATSGYWGCCMHEEDIEKTAFLTWTHGLLEWVRMPMGLKNSGATYQRMLQQVLGPLLWESSSRKPLGQKAGRGRVRLASTLLFISIHS